LLGGTHFEEVLVLTTSEVVVPVHSVDWGLLLWSLDIPENVIWNGVEDLFLSCSLHAALVGVSKISCEIVLFTLEESSKCFSCHILEFIDVELSFSSLKLFHKFHCKSFLVLLINLPDLILSLELFEFSFQGCFVIEVKLLKIGSRK
jgi:hypothetical protein